MDILILSDFGPSSHIDGLINDLERVRAEGIRLLHREIAKPIIPGQ
jgi:hypothetical protein